MPKASFAVKDAVEVSMGIQEGWIEVINAVVKSHQYPPNKATGKQGAPFPCVQLTVMRTDDKGVRLGDDIEETLELGIGGVNKKDPTDWKFRPGKASGADDDDPEDLGIEVDTEGNCIYLADADAKLNKKCKWLRFTTSLEEKGFKPSVLANGYMPDLIGLKGYIKTITLDKLPGAAEEDKNPTAYVMEKILQFPYDVKPAKAGKAQAGAKAAGKPAAGKPAPAAKSAPAPAPAAAPAQADGDSEAIAVEKLLSVYNELAGDEAVEVERKKIQTGVQTKLMREKVPVKLHKPVMDLIKDASWLTAQAENEDSPLYSKLAVDGDNVTLAATE